MKHFLTRIAAAALLVGGAMSAHADVNLALTGWQYSGNNVNITATGTTPAAYAGAAGAFKGSLSGAGIFDSPSFVTYCVELEQSFSWSSNLTSYTLVSPAAYSQASPNANGWGPNAVTIGNRLGELLTYALPLVTNAANSTALQLAIWNTIYDTDLTVSSGTFTDASTFAGQANTYLLDSSGNGSTLQVGILTNSNKQDFIVAAPVPEPSTYALMLAGLAGMGFVARRRSRRD